MKSFILLSLLALSLCSISDPNCRIRQVLNEFKQRLPALEKEVYTQETYPKLDIKGIVGKGFRYYSENTEVMKYEGVEQQYLNDFIDYMQNNVLNVPSNYQGKMGSVIKMLKAAKFKQVLTTDMLYAENSAKDQCKYFNMLAQKNSDGTYDFMFGQILTTFKMAPDVYVIVKKDSKSWFGLSHTYEEDVVEIPKTISEEGMKKLFQYLEICVFKEYFNVASFGPKY